MQCQGLCVPPSHVEVSSGVCGEQCQPPSVLGTWRCPFPACKSGVTPFYRHQGLSPGTTGGDRGGERVKSMRLSNADSFQPSPASNLPARRPQGCSCVSGGGHAASPPQPLSATVSHSSAGLHGSALSPGWECCLGSQTPRDDGAGVPPPFTAATHSMS